MQGKRIGEGSVDPRRSIRCDIHPRQIISAVSFLFITEVVLKIHPLFLGGTFAEELIVMWRPKTVCMTFWRDRNLGLNSAFVP